MHLHVHVHVHVQGFLIHVHVLLMTYYILYMCNVRHIYTHTYLYCTCTSFVECIIMHMYSMCGSTLNERRPTQYSRGLQHLWVFHRGGRIIWGNFRNAILSECSLREHMYKCICIHNPIYCLRHITSHSQASCALTHVLVTLLAVGRESSSTDAWIHVRSSSLREYTMIASTTNKWILLGCAAGDNARSEYLLEWRNSCVQHTIVVSRTCGTTNCYTHACAVHVHVYM